MYVIRWIRSFTNLVFVLNRFFLDPERDDHPQSLLLSSTLCSASLQCWNKLVFSYFPQGIQPSLSLETFSYSFYYSILLLRWFLLWLFYCQYVCFWWKYFLYTRRRTKLKEKKRWIHTIQRWVLFTARRFEISRSWAGTYPQRYFVIAQTGWSTYILHRWFDLKFDIALPKAKEISTGKVEKCEGIKRKPIQLVCARINRVDEEPQLACEHVEGWQ